MHQRDDGIVGLVLAGGRSSRMGRDKAMLPWGGVSLLAHMRQLLHEAGVKRVLISGDYPEDSVADRIPELGPLGGVASVADTLPDCSLLVVPVDMPRLSPEVLRHLCVTSRTASACFQGHPLPLWLRLDPASRHVLARLLAGPPPGRSPRALHADLHGETLDLPAHWAGQLRDADTPEDWQGLRVN